MPNDISRFRGSLSAAAWIIFLWLPFFQPELPDLLMSPIKATAPKWFFPPNWMIGKQIMTKHQWFVWETFWFMFQTHFYPHLGFLKIPEVIHGDSCLIECLSDVTPCYSRFFFAIKGSFPDVQPVTVEVTCIAALVSAQTASAGHRNGKDS